MPNYRFKVSFFGSRGFLTLEYYSGILHSSLSFFLNYFYDTITLLSMFSNNFLIWRDENYFIITFVSIIKLLLYLLEKILIST